MTLWLLWLFWRQIKIIFGREKIWQNGGTKLRYSIRQRSSGNCTGFAVRALPLAPIVIQQQRSFTDFFFKLMIQQRCACGDGPKAIGKRIVGMGKNAEINYLPQRCIRKNCLQRPPMLCKIWGIKKKIVCTAGVEEKNLQALSRWWKKISCLLEITIAPGEKIMVRPLCCEVMVPLDNRTLAFSTELLNYIIPFATQGKSGHYNI